MKKAVVLYVPVIHKGYLDFLKKHRRAAGLFVLGEDLLGEFRTLHREIRALAPAAAAKFLDSLKLFPSVKVLGRKNLRGLKGWELITADEEVSRRFVKKYFPRAKVVFDKVFLRWDDKSVKTQKPPKGAVSRRAFDRKMMALAEAEGEKSSDWWRRVGAVAVKGDRAVIKTHNVHVPSEQMPYLEGDPRDFIKAGEKPELATVIHAEQGVVAEAARRGLTLSGARFYVTAFPCPVCAKLIAYSGVKKCFFRTGSATLDGERILKSRGVKIVRVA